jgi:3-deoxy-D-manno-octulosonic-acid transferase
MPRRAFRRPFVVYVPRAPERFDETAGRLAAAGLSTLRRSIAFGADLALAADPGNPDHILLGDSLGEMNFYLAMSDLVVVGGGFMPKGSHNIIEPLALGKPVIVGPETWTIEYPAEEAIAAGVCRRVAPGDLAAALAPARSSPRPRQSAPFSTTTPARWRKTLDAIPRLLAR